MTTQAVHATLSATLLMPSQSTLPLLISNTPISTASSSSSQNLSNNEDNCQPIEMEWLDFDLFSFLE
jgi:hypothetical protein